MWSTIRREWDRLAVHILLMSFGIYSMITPILSVSRAVPSWAETMFNVEFMVAAGLLMVGTIRQRKRLRVLGYGIAFLGLTTVALLILIAGGARVGAYSLLIFAFAMEFIVGLRRINHNPIQEKEIQEMIRRAVRGDDFEEER